MKNRCAGNNVGEFATDAHDLLRVGDSFEIIPVLDVGVSAFGRNDDRFVARPKPRTDTERAVTADGGFDEVLGEALSLRLRANKNADAKYDAEKT